MKKATKDWALPIEDWEIIFRFRQKDAEYRYTFYNIPSLSNYFRNVPEQAMLVGYYRELPEHRQKQTLLPVSEGRLSMWFVECGRSYSIEFTDVFEFVSFLQTRPYVALAVSYTNSNSQGGQTKKARY